MKPRWSPEPRSANPVVVFDLTDHLRKAFEDFCNTYHEEVPYLDAFMGVHNFHKLIVLDIANRQEFTDTERRRFFKMAIDTLAEGLTRGRTGP